ncbi:MAG: outer membrane lipoprotein carrier protein LolA [Thermoflavifilum sp.]|nr:outer membrane lipoprotein carrier protein LolA [Thermoflavifilum sp.]
MKNVLCFFLLLLYSLSGFAQQMTPYGQSDPKAKALLDALSKRYQSYHSIKAIFKLQVFTPDGKLADQKTGQAILQGNAYRIDIGGQELISDGKTTWNYSKETNEVQINNYSPDNNMISPTRLFTHFYDQDFLYRLMPDTRKNGRVYQHIEMTPFDKSKSYFRIDLTIDKAKQQIIQALIYDKSGVHYVYSIQQFIPNVKIPAQMFTFNAKAHPGVNVVDLRT